jgi:hypothetical protein
MTWSDRENVIRSGGFDILDDLPHFLLVLIIIQRFDLARWGFFTEFQGSPIHRKEFPHSSPSHLLEVTFEGGNTIQVFPVDDPLHGGINLIGRSTGVAGGRNKTDQQANLGNAEQIREDNDLVVKFSWPNEKRTSEVEIIAKARNIGEADPIAKGPNDLVRGHIPTVLGHMDPPYLTCSTKPIREFLKLESGTTRVLRIIAFRRLTEIKLLDEEHLLIAYLDVFFCKFFRGLYTIS